KKDTKMIKFIFGQFKIKLTKCQMEYSAIFAENHEPVPCPVQIFCFMFHACDISIFSCTAKAGFNFIIGFYRGRYLACFLILLGLTPNFLLKAVEKCWGFL